MEARIFLLYIGLLINIGVVKRPTFAGENVFEHAIKLKSFVQQVD